MLTNSVDKVYIRAAAVKKGACESRDRLDLGTARDTGGDLVSRRLSDWHGHAALINVDSWIGSPWNFTAMRSRSRSSRISCDRSLAATQRSCAALARAARDSQHALADEWILKALRARLSLYSTWHHDIFLH